MPSAPQLPMSTSPQQKSARMEVVWMLNQSSAMKKAFALNIFNTAINTWWFSSCCRLLSNYDLLTRISQLLQTTTCPQILAQFFHRWNVLSDITSFFLNAKSSEVKFFFSKSHRLSIWDFLELSGVLNQKNNTYRILLRLWLWYLRKNLTFMKSLCFYICQTLLLSFHTFSFSWGCLKESSVRHRGVYFSKN